MVIPESMECGWDGHGKAYLNDLESEKKGDS